MISIKQYCNERLFKLSRIKLLPNEIHLWSINWKELEDYIHKYKNLISIQEEQRVYSFKFYEDRMRCMTGKILTKLQPIMIRSWICQYCRYRQHLKK